MRHVRQRDRRREALGADMFREPAWDILLDLYCAGLAGRDVSIMDACAASGVPATTGLRYVRRLLASKLVVRVDDASDRRRSLVRLSSETSERMEAWLRETWSFTSDSRG